MSIVITEKLAEDIKVGDLVRSENQISFQKANRIEKAGGRVDLWFDKNIIGGRKFGVNSSTLWSDEPVEIKETK
jgi:hypothetical protein